MKQRKQKSKMSSLSDDELTVILEYCDLQDTIHLGSVCKRFNHVSNSERIWVELTKGKSKEEYVSDKKDVQLAQDLSVCVLQRDGKQRGYRIQLTCFFASILLFAICLLTFVLITGLSLDRIILVHIGGNRGWLIHWAIFLLGAIFYIMSIVSYLLVRPTGLLPEKLSNRMLYRLWSRHGPNSKKFYWFVRLFFNDTSKCMSIRQRVLNMKKVTPFCASITFLFMFYTMLQHLWIPVVGIMTGIGYAVCNDNVLQLVFYFMIPAFIWILVSSIFIMRKAFEITSYNIPDEDYTTHFQLKEANTQTIRDHRRKFRIVSLCMAVHNIALALTLLGVSFKLSGWLSDDVLYLYLCAPFFIGVIMCIFTAAIGTVSGVLADLFSDVFGETYETWSFSVAIILAYIATLVVGIAVCMVGYGIIIAPTAALVAMVALKADFPSLIAYHSLTLSPAMAISAYVIIQCTYWLLFKPGSPLLNVLDESLVEEVQLRFISVVGNTA
jgi:hypothetical protein